MPIVPEVFQTSKKPKPIKLKKRKVKKRKTKKRKTKTNLRKK